MIQLTMVSTGLANVASVRAAFTRMGAEVVDATSPEQVLTAPGVVLPGVGSLGPAMQGLRDAGLVAALQQRVAEGLPTLCICLGMQLLCASSEEAPGDVGLGLADVEVQRLRNAPRLPHFGWNRIEPQGACELLPSGAMYFAHSFGVTQAPPGWNVAWCGHGERFVAAMERGDVLACQFHPELSGAVGAGLLERWLGRVARRTGSEVGTC